MRELQGSAVGEARTAGPRAIGGRQHVRGLIVATVAAVLMTIVGAFGTSQLPILQRLAYWLIIMEAGAMIGFGASTGVRSWGRFIERSFWEGAAISLLVAVPVTLVTTGTTTLFFGARTLSLGDAVTLFASVFVVTAAITAINYLAGRGDAAVLHVGDLHTVRSTEGDAQTLRESTPNMLATDPSSGGERLLERLPPHMRRDTIYALESEDHYVRVHTSGGSDLILLRMGDAVAELDGLVGERTHRSWWVAREAVASAARSDGRAELTLINGVVAPVSRSALPAIQEQGWFKST